MALEGDAYGKLRYATFVERIAIPTFLRLDDVGSAYVGSSESKSKDIEVLVVENVIELSAQLDSDSFRDGKVLEK